MRTLLSVALVAGILGAARAEDVPNADKAIEAAIHDLKSVLDRTNSLADKQKLTEAIGALERAAKGGEKKVYTRQAFKDLVVGKSEAQVKALLGKPDTTTDMSSSIDYSVIWHYTDLTKDPDAEKIDHDVTILFDVKGIAVSVGFAPFGF